VKESPHILVVGGSRGLGKEFIQLARDRLNVVSAVARSFEHDPDSGMYWFDVTTGCAPSLLKRVTDDCGPLTGIAFFQRYRGAGDDWQGEIDTSLKATAEIIHRCPAFMEPGAPCSVVLTASMAAEYVWPHVPLSYHLAKAGLCQMARYFAVRFGNRDLRVNAVCPGTFLKAENAAWYQEHREERERCEQALPRRQMGTAREVAEVILFLLSEKASFINGQAIVVDGGASLRASEARGEMQ
jgi:NAD(P)-dependent dehydrogenase (short-subunit alcohol dehydrogenase family)